MSYIAVEIGSQPGVWRRAARIADEPSVRETLPAPGERVAVVGCGTSLYMAQTFAVMREAHGLGLTDFFPASEFPRGRGYDRVVAITRSGTTTEIIDLLQALDSVDTTVLTTSPDLPVVRVAARAVVLDFADELSVVQTRFATGALALWREVVDPGRVDVAADQAEQLLAVPINPAFIGSRQFVFLGTGWTVGIANEAALKMRETAQAWAEAYPAMEYRHGPICVADERSTVFSFGETPAGLAHEIAATGARFVPSVLDAMAQLTTVQRLAVALAEHKGLDPDRPRNLTRSIVLDPAVGT